jgi:hypothetical protein
LTNPDKINLSSLYVIKNLVEELLWK